VRHDRRLCIFGELELLVRSLAHQPEEIPAKRFVDLVEHVARGPAGPGECRAHPDRLTALTRENERAHLVLYSAKQLPGD
jgi:hypothetical protein